MDIIKKISSPANQPAEGEFTVKVTAISPSGRKFVERFNVTQFNLAETAHDFGMCMSCEHDVEISTIQISMSFEKLDFAIIGE